MTREALLAWRTRLGLSQAAAAEALGCGRRTIQYYETGVYPVPRYIALAAAAVAHGIAPEGTVYIASRRRVAGKR